MKEVVIEDDVWIGGGALVNPGVAIGRGAVIFADSDEGLFGQFHDNSFVKVGLKYTF